MHTSAPLLSPALNSTKHFRDKYVSLACFTGNSFFQKMWRANFQPANSYTCNSQTCNSQFAHYPDSLPYNICFRWSSYYVCTGCVWNRGSYMSVHVLMNLINGLGKKIRCETLPIIQEHECNILREAVKMFVDNFNNLQTVWRKLVKLTDIIPWYFWKSLWRNIFTNITELWLFIGLYAPG